MMKESFICLNRKICWLSLNHGNILTNLILCSVGPYKLARALGLCLEYRSSFSEACSTPSTQPMVSRSQPYGFSEVSPIRCEVSDPISGPMDPPNCSDRTVIAKPFSRKQTSELNILARSESESNREDTLEQTGFADAPVARSIVLIVEDNPINLKVVS